MILKNIIFIHKYFLLMKKKKKNLNKSNLENLSFILFVNY